MLNKRRLKQLTEIVIAFLIFCSIPPYFVWHYSAYLQLLIPIMIVGVSMIYCKSLSKRNIVFVLCLACVYLLFALRDGKNIVGIIANISIVFIFGFNTNLINLTYKRFVDIYCLFLFPSILVYVAVVLLGVDLPYTIIEPENALKDYLFRNYPCLILTDTLSDSTFRFCSYFDEPGVVGTISGILLLINGINYKKWQTWILLISGIFSLSFAFFLLLICNIILFQSMKVKVVFGSLILLLLIIFTGNDVINNLLLERFVVENGQLAGVNRTTSSMDFFMSTFGSSDKLYLGYGSGFSQKYVNVGGASYKDLLINYGIVGLGLLSVMSCFMGIKYVGVTKKLFVYGLIWGCIIYQRPFIFNLIYFYLMYIILFVQEYNKERTI